MCTLNTTIRSDIINLSREELANEYEILSTAYRDQKSVNEKCLQEIYDLKRSLKTATNAEAFLNSELESLSTVHSNELEQTNNKYKKSLSEYKLKCDQANELNVGLEMELDNLKKDFEQFKQKIDENKENIKSTDEITTPKKSELLIKLAKSEQETIDLIDKIGGLQHQILEAKKQIINQECNIEDLRDRLECSECTLQSKREEIDEKNELYESSQQRIFQLTTELATYKTDSSVDEKKRGNSLFAEVDDQRQKMKQILAAQKQHYDQMKLKYNQSQQEIRLLKRENCAMRKEVKLCSNIFLHADQTFKEKLNKRIGELTQENKKLEEKLHWTERKLIGIANEKDISWLDSMLTFCRNETTQLKDQLSSCRLQKAAAEDLLRNTDQNMVRWRLETVKLRCLLIHRETLLDENKIQYEQIPNNLQKSIKQMDKTKLTTPNKCTQIVDNIKIEKPPSEPLILEKISVYQPNNIEMESLTIKTEEILSSSSINDNLSIVIDHNSTNNTQNTSIEYEQNNCTIKTPNISIKNEMFAVPAIPAVPPSSLTQSHIKNKELINKNHQESLFVPEYRSMNLTPQSMTSLKKNLELIVDPSSTAKVVKKLFSNQNDDDDDDDKDYNGNGKRHVKFMINNEQGKCVNENRKRVNTITSQPPKKSEDLDGNKSKGIIKRVIVKSKKPI